MLKNTIAFFVKFMPVLENKTEGNKSLIYLLSSEPNVYKVWHIRIVNWSMGKYVDFMVRAYSMGPTLSNLA
jgi:hypothetical protein